MKTLYYKLLLLLALTFGVNAFGACTVSNVVDTLYDSQSNLINTTALIQWPTFRTASNDLVNGGQRSVTITNGALNLQLCPTAGSPTSGGNVYYTVRFRTNVNGQVTPVRYWRIPAGGGTYTMSDVAADVSGAVPGITISLPQIQNGSATNGQALVYSTTTKTWVPTTLSGGGDLSTVLLKANNLSDLVSASTARTNLGLGTHALKNSLASGDIPNNAANTSGNAATATLASAATALAANGTNCGSGEASRGVDASGNAEGCFAPSGSGDLLSTNNLSDLTNAGTARTNLGLGTAAVMAGPSGTIVGTTDTQTLTNKTVNGVTPTVFGYLDPTSSVQTQLNGKQASLGFTPLNAASNLSDLASASTARTNLGLGSLATLSSVPNNSANTTGNADTATLAAAATALAANGTNCAAGEASKGVDASGNAEGCVNPNDVSYLEVTASTYTVLPADNHKYIVFYRSAAGTGVKETVTLPASGTISAGFTVDLYLNAGDNATMFKYMTVNRSGSDLINKSYATIDIPFNTPARFTYVGGTEWYVKSDVLLGPSGPISYCYTGLCTPGNSLTLGASTITTSNTITVSGGSSITLSCSGGACGTLTLPKTGTILSTTEGVALTATALAANGSNCPAGQAPRGVDASGAAENCTTYLQAANDLSDLASASTARTNLGLGTAAVMAGPSGTIVGTTDTQTLTNKTVNGVTPTVFGYLDPTSSVQTQLNGKLATGGTAALATALAANGTNCGSGEAARGVDASGNAENCFTPSGGSTGKHGLMWPFGVPSTSAATGFTTANRVYYFSIPSSGVSLGEVVLRAHAGSGGGSTTVGIYDYSCNLVQQSDVVTSAASTIMRLVFSPEVPLTNTTSYYLALSSAAVDRYNSIYFSDLLADVGNIGSVKEYFYGSNAMASDVLPSTCGTRTVLNNDFVPAFGYK